MHESWSHEHEHDGECKWRRVSNATNDHTIFDKCGKSISSNMGQAHSIQTKLHWYVLGEVRFVARDIIFTCHVSCGVWRSGSGNIILVDFSSMSLLHRSRYPSILQNIGLERVHETPSEKSRCWGMRAKFMWVWLWSIGFSIITQRRRIFLLRQVVV